MINRLPLTENKSPLRFSQSKVVKITKGKNNQNTFRLDYLLQQENPKICIVRKLGGIGDVLMSTPILKRLKYLVPSCHLTYATDLTYSNGALGDIIKHNPYVDSLISSDNFNIKDYHYSIDITATGLSVERSGSIPPNRIDLFAQAIGIDVSCDPVPTYILTQSEITKAKETISSLFSSSVKPLIAIQTRSNDYRRTWPSEKIIELLRLLEDKYRVILLDWHATPNLWPEETENRKNLFDLSFSDCAGIINEVNLVVCPDSSILHLAGALDKRIVSIFGPIPAQSRINHYKKAMAVQKKLSCSNCWYLTRCVKLNIEKLQCLTSITAKEVFQAIIEKLTDQTGITVTKITESNQLKDMSSNILIKRITSGLGDMLMVTPTLEALKLKFPHKNLHVLCQPSTTCVLQNNPNIDKIIDNDFNVNSQRYFMSLDLSYPCSNYEVSRLKSKKLVEKNRSEVFAEACGVRDLLKNLVPQMYFTNTEIQTAKEKLNSGAIKSDLVQKLNDSNSEIQNLKLSTSEIEGIGISNSVRALGSNDILKVDSTLGNKKKILCIGLGSAELYRNWPYKYYIELLELLREDYSLVLLGSKDSNIYPSYTIDFRGIGFRESCAVLKLSDGLLTVDTSFLHASAAFGIPTIALFGPIDYRARCKGYNNVLVVKSDLPCIPCWRNGDIKCKLCNSNEEYSKCMTSIYPKRLSEIIKNKFV